MAITKDELIALLTELKQEGYNVSRIERILNSDLYTLLEQFNVFMDDVNRLIILRKEYLSMDLSITSVPDDLKSAIESRLWDPDAIDELEQLLRQLRSYMAGTGTPPQPITTDGSQVSEKKKKAWLQEHQYIQSEIKKLAESKIKGDEILTSGQMPTNIEQISEVENDAETIVQTNDTIPSDDDNNMVDATEISVEPIHHITIESAIEENGTLSSVSANNSESLDHNTTQLHTEKCKSCKGTGECYSCQGSGKCFWCNGTGIVKEKGEEKKCVYCSGTGNCYWCNGTGTCAKCDGKGYI